MNINGKDNGLSYEETMRIEFEKLEKAIHLEDYLIKGISLQEIMDKIDEDNEELDLFDMINESEFEDYIKEKYNVKTYEVSKIYLR